MEAKSIAELLQRLKLWQIVLVLGIAAPFASHYGWAIPSNYAIMIFLAMTLVAIGIRYFPPPEPVERRHTPEIAISAHQSAFCSQFDQWTPFEDASMKRGPEDDDGVETLREKVKQLRLELGTTQRILMRKVENGKHYVKYCRADDETTYVPNNGD